MGGGVCTIECGEECPQGFVCRQLLSAAPDVVFVCMSEFSNLCRPCASAADCKSQAGGEDVCVAYGGEGSFCGGACQATQECPWGFSCKSVKTSDGLDTMQCVADAGVCPCTARSIALALWTPCEISNDQGVCSGKRVCGQEGLSACDAPVPAAETCNGLDEDCDGDTDEPVLEQGKLKELCADGNDCTDDLCEGEGGCQHAALSDVECKDGNTCTVADHCDAGVCVGKAVDCDDKNACTDDTCDEAGGCINAANTDLCDDGDPCTVADQCAEGQCIGYAVSCDCAVDADCAPLEDGDVCNGTLTCDDSVVPFQCAVDQATVKNCQEPAGVDAPCLVATCDPVTGVCGFGPAHEGGGCDDGSACTVNDVCVAGKCAAGPAANCNDGNLCTDDVCDPVTGCQHFPNAKACTDGDVCTTGDICQEGQCTSTGYLDCDDGNVCTDDACLALTGCAHAPNALPCDDGNACTEGDACVDGQCKGKTQAMCDDGNPCTADTCVAGSGCVHDAVSGPCSDGDACTVGDQCGNGVCVPGAAMECGDANPCTDDACVSGVCKHTPNAAACDDGNACTLGDYCAGGACKYKTVEDCSDNNVCTTDGCDPGDGCFYLLNTVACDDGSACTVADACKGGQCAGGKLLACDDGNPCTDDSCDPKSGCVHVNNKQSCDDGNACTTGETCSAGKCVAKTPVSCDDGNVCTTDSCLPDSGCLHADNTNPCDDLNLCTNGDVCAAGSCVPGPAITCNDGNECTDDSCDPALGCQYAPAVSACDDGSVCTSGDACKDGLCVPGPVIACTDGNGCTDDSCDPALGCQFLPNAAACNDGDPCTVTDTCAGAKCVGSGALVCNDNNACTLDACVAKVGCTYTPIDSQCNDNNPCTDDTCHTVDGCKHTFNAAPCDDGKACTSGDVCSGGNCAGTPGKVKVYDNNVGAVTLLSCGGGYDGFNFLCHYLNYGDATGDHPTGDYQGGSPCWAVGEADGQINKLYGGCGGGCTHWLYVECYTCK
jgi:hypothetical protein